MKRMAAAKKKKKKKKIKTSKDSPGSGSFSRRFVIFSFIFFLSLIFYVWSRTHAVQMGYELNKVVREEQKLLEIQRSLNLELRNLTTLERVERIARKKFGLVDPRPNQVVYLSDGKSKESK
jgi:cell division protein FtsL